MQERTGYQRRYLRAPFTQDILFVEQNFVFKGKAINISEGGMLLGEVGFFPESDSVHFMIRLPQFPLFKNFSSEKVSQYRSELLEAKTVRFKAKMVRKVEIRSKVDELFHSQIGLSILEIKPFDQAKIASYVDVFSSNLIYLLVLLDNINEDRNNLQKIRSLSRLLGYNPFEKISVLRTLIERDYKSLQWL